MPQFFAIWTTVVHLKGDSMDPLLYRAPMAHCEIWWVSSIFQFTGTYTLHTCCLTCLKLSQWNDWILTMHHRGLSEVKTISLCCMSTYLRLLCREWNCVYELLCTVMKKSRWNNSSHLMKQSCTRCMVWKNMRPPNLMVDIFIECINNMLCTFIIKNMLLSFIHFLSPPLFSWGLSQELLDNWCLW